jgi:hypothetical protein
MKQLFSLVAITAAVFAASGRSQKVPPQAEAIFCGSFVITGDQREHYFDYFQQMGCETVRFRELSNTQTEEQALWLAWGVREEIRAY